MDDRTVTPCQEALEARDNFLAHYTAGTRKLYELDMRIWFTWCQQRGIDPLSARRSTLEAFVNDLMTQRGNSARSAVRRFQTVRSWFRLAVADELVHRDPTLMVRLPKWRADRTKVAWLNEQQVGRLLRAAADRGPNHHALIALMAMLGLRVTEACSIDVDDFTEDPLGYTILKVTRKGGWVDEIPVPVPLLRILERARAGRETGPLVRTKRGNRQTRNGAYLWVKLLCQDAGLPDDVHPHSLRHSSISALVNAGVSIVDAQRFAGHRDVRSTEWYYHQTPSLDRHGAHVTARVFASAV